MSDVIGYLRNRGLALKQADARNVHLACFFCGEDPSARGRLYVNVDPEAEVPGLYMCHLCGAKGNLTSIKKHFGDQVADKEIDLAVRSDIMALAADHYTVCLHDYPEVLTYLTGPERGLQGATIATAQLGYAPMAFEQDLLGDDISVRSPTRLYGTLREAGFGHDDIIGTGLCQEQRDGVADALRGMITIPYLVAGNVVTIRGRTWPYGAEDFEIFGGKRYTPPRNKYKTLAGSKARLFNVDALWNTDHIFCTEGEFDALMLGQHGYPAVGVPGATSWQDHWDDYFETIRRIWVVFDRDLAGERAANKLLDRFGPKARPLHLSEEGTKCDPTQWFAHHDVSEFEALLAGARRGGLLVTVDEARDEFETIQGQPGLRFGWELLDVLISPGLQASQLMVLLAKTGTGKTVALLNFMHRVRMFPGQEDLKILFVSLEQTRGEWWDRARRIHTFYELNGTEEDAADFWRNNLLVIDRNRLSEAELRGAIDDYAYDMGRLPDLVCLDYLGYFARSFKGESYQRTSDAAMALKSVAKDYRIPFIVPQQVSRIGVDGQEFAADSARDSVAGDSLITLATGERVPIADLVGTQPEVVVLGPDFRFRTRKAERVWCKGVRPVFQVTTRTGRTLRCTASHPLLTVDGWTKVRDLRISDEIAVPPDTSEGLLQESVSEHRFDPIVEIATAGEESVYDMSVVGIHNFVANEIIVSNSGVIEETADFLLTMWTPDNALGREEEERSGQIHLRIGKSRHGGRGALLQMQFAPISLALVPEGDPLCARARQEVAWKKRYRDDWQRAVHRHRTGAEGHLQGHLQPFVVEAPKFGY